MQREKELKGEKDLTKSFLNSCKKKETKKEMIVLAM
jgi:hypothetical protein